MFLESHSYISSYFFSVSPCDNLSCLNEGSCRVEAGVGACFCKGDYSGSTCEGKRFTCN